MTTTIARTTPADSVIDEAADIVAAYFSRLLPVLESHAQQLSAQLDGLASEGLTAARVDELVKPHAGAIMDDAGEPVYGAGFIATVDLLDDAPSHLAWWQGEDRRKLVFPPQSVKQGIDYRELEWFRVPLMSGRSHIAGPYVDYLCSDEYTMTAATPVRAGGRFAGVAGLDVVVEAIERRLTPPLRALGAELVLVNGVDRVLVSTDPRYGAGDVLRPAQAVVMTRRRCDQVDLDILALA
ncbi:cache domain-containing protein [Microbacterium koreense]|uniref:Cache domain-containing protein n=1 Tax=Microbacterium koreense TaxID=323761 RepID=A0ABW2ZQ45_9MICO